MAKSKSFFFCRECGYQSSSWLGRCPECGKFGTFDEEVVKTVSSQSHSHSATQPLSAPVLLREVSYGQSPRVSTCCAEFDRVLGGGIVPGSLLLLGGDPGIGKSTLLLQTALAMQGARILYVSGEESEQQIKMRADRLGGRPTNDLYLLSETDVQRILQQVDALRPDLLIVDSIQTVTTDDIPSPAGSVAQIRQCTTHFQQLAKTSGIPVLLIGHITKDGTLAGPKVMEHIVDAVLQFEGDRQHGFRILRALKNRFGSTSEIGIFEMRADGLHQVENPSATLLSQRDETLSGTAVCATLEGARPIFIEVQSLVSSAVYGTPQRNASGFDLRRLNLLLAVFEKRCGFKLGAKDVFLNIAGGIRVSDPAIDLAVAAAVLSSNVDIPVPSGTCLAAEIGLSGEVRPVARVEQRIAEAARLGFKRIIISKYNARSLDLRRYKIEVLPVSLVEEAVRALFA
ncbi:MAG: DNA repair protein RadA [Bacteroidales bacterium]|nr:DNA repair protein RadA [Bacteroidales bacterium]